MMIDRCQQLVLLGGRTYFDQLKLLLKCYHCSTFCEVLLVERNWKKCENNKLRKNVRKICEEKKIEEKFCEKKIRKKFEKKVCENKLFHFLWGFIGRNKLRKKCENNKLRKKCEKICEEKKRLRKSFVKKMRKEINKLFHFVWGFIGRKKWKCDNNKLRKKCEKKMWGKKILRKSFVKQMRKKGLLTGKNLRQILKGLYTQFHNFFYHCSTFCGFLLEKNERKKIKERNGRK